jgi:hypothetical protein
VWWLSTFFYTIACSGADVLCVHQCADRAYPQPCWACCSSVRACGSKGLLRGRSRGGPDGLLHSLGVGACPWLMRADALSLGCWPHSAGLAPAKQGASNCWEVGHLEPNSMWVSFFGLFAVEFVCGHVSAWRVVKVLCTHCVCQAAHALHTLYIDTCTWCLVSFTLQFDAHHRQYSGLARASVCSVQVKGLGCR